MLIEADENRSLAYEVADPRCGLKPLAQHYIALSRVQHNNSEENQRVLKWTTEQVCKGLQGFQCPQIQSPVGGAELCLILRS